MTYPSWVEEFAHQQIVKVCHGCKSRLIRVLPSDFVYCPRCGFEGFFLQE